MAMKTRGTRHHRHQESLGGFDYSCLLTSWQQASGVVGEFFELLTARMVDGYRRAVVDHAGDNPDVVSGDLAYESKAAGRERWLLEEAQTHAFAANPNGRYVLWEYTTPPVGGLVQFGTVAGLRAWLASNITRCVVMPSHYPGLVLAGTAHAQPRRNNDHWGSNYWFRTRYLSEVLMRERSIDARFTVRTSGVQLEPVAGTAVDRFTVTWLIDLPDHITPIDQAFARAALRDLDEKRHVVELVPCDRGPGKKRVVTSRNAEWYRDFIARRQIPTKWRDRARSVVAKNPRTSGRRQNVRRALERIVANEPRPQGNWIGWELIELLRDHDARAER